jgi:hypothetical protein
LFDASAIATASPPFESEPEVQAIAPAYPVRACTSDGIFAKTTYPPEETMVPFGIVPVTPAANDHPDMFTDAAPAL